MRTEDIEYRADGRQMLGHLAIDDHKSGTRPAVLVCHEGPGLTGHAKDKALRLASAGYAAFALDYHGGGQPLDRDQMMPRLGELMASPDRIVDLAQAGMDILLAQDVVDRTRTAAIGYCFGGTMALHLARSGAPIDVAIGFHSGLATQRPAEPGKVIAGILVCIGADDPMIPPEQRTAFEEEMRRAGADWRMNLYGGALHSFTNPDAPASGFPGVAYDRATDERSWRAMLDFFEERFGAV